MGMNKPFAPPLAPEPPTYQADFAGWAQAQADLLRAGRVADLDVANIVEELESLGRAEFDKLTSVLCVVLHHMLKWDYQPQRRSRSWVATLREYQRRAERQLKVNPSLKPRLVEAISEAYEDACDRAEGETGLERATFPQACPYSWDEITGRPFDLDQAP
jgi:hypothetical protein